MTNATNLEIAETIRQQLGGKALMMLGAKDFLADEKSLHFKIRGSRKVNKIVITLTPEDLYKIDFLKCTAYRFNLRTGKTTGGVKEVKSVDGVSVSNLHETIEQATGLYTKLF